MPVGPYSQDVVTGIVNVQWEGGLAVEFSDKSKLTNANGNPSFTKTVISLWFRIPKASIDAAAAAYDSEAATAPFNGIMPLVVMGRKGKLGSIETEPACIAIDCFGGSAGLVIKFETSQDATWDGYDLGFPETVAISSHRSSITPDRWHHLLVSPDFSGSIATHGWAFDKTVSNDPEQFNAHIDSTFHMYMALDDVNLTGVDLSEHNPYGYADVNAIVNNDSLLIANAIQESFTPPDPHDPPFPTGPIPTYSSGSVSVPNGAIGIPATAEFVDSIHRLEIAEFMMWIGATLDTGVLANRRAFIDSEGKPVPPDQEPTEGDPRMGSIMLMRRPPDIMLHGSSNWIKGHNTGSTGVDPDGEDKPEGQFTPAGTIEKYVPDPSLHGNQG